MEHDDTGCISACDSAAPAHRDGPFRIMEEAMTMKRMLSFALTLLMLAGAFSACSETGKTDADNAPVSADPQTADAAETEPEETDLLDTLPEGDFGGRADRSRG